MLVGLNEILKIAEDQKIAVGAFDTPNLECVMAVLGAAREHDYPVILSHAQLHEPVMPLRVIGPILLQAAEKAPVPVCVHLDHGETLEYLEEALELGFPSIMYDGSLLPYEENVGNTKRAVAMAKKYHAGVEAELGVMGGREAGGKSGKAEDLYTDPDAAARFVKETGIDALAASFGTAHGFYKIKPKLDFDRIERIRALTGLPLVMHGGSGVSPEDYTTAIEKGIRKINYYSYMARAGVESVKKLLASREVSFFHDVAAAATEGMKEDAAKAMSVFCRGYRKKS